MSKETSYEKLKWRSEHCVCKMCGSQLEIKLIIYNQYGGQGMDLYCPQCQRIEYGTDPEVYRLASGFLKQFEFNYFWDMPEGERNTMLNTGKLCEIIGWALNNHTKSSGE